MGTIAKAKKNALIDTAYGIIKAGENYQVSRNFDTNGDVSNLIIDDLVTDTKLAYKGTKPKAGKLLINQKGESAIAIWSGQFCARKGFEDKKIMANSDMKSSESCIESVFEKAEFDFVKDVQTYKVQKTGTYLIELWGASGGSFGMMNAYGGKGAYVSGRILLKQGETLYIYVGENPTFISGLCYNYNKNDSFNGSAVGSCSGGGGATDVRLVSGAWNDFDSLKSRIMVAAGGGGALYEGIGGSAGGLIGETGVGKQVDGMYDPGKGSTQHESWADIFGVASFGTTLGGGGYYGGHGGQASNAGGGSSFISGYTGCDAIDSNSVVSDIIHTGQPNHYSGKVFTNATMISGNDSMPNPRENGTMQGNVGNGYAKITLVSVN